MGASTATLVEQLRERLAGLPLNERIKIERTMAGLTVSQCTRAMGWSRHRIWQRVEEGERRLTEDEIRRVADVLGVPVSRLLGQHAQTVPGYMRRGRPRKVAA